jgi:hypothetical protein
MALGSVITTELSEDRETHSLSDDAIALRLACDYRRCMVLAERLTRC